MLYEWYILIKKMLKQQVPQQDIATNYQDRCWSRTDSTFFYIQPFWGISASTQHVELILDNNAFIDLSVNNAPQVIKNKNCIPENHAYDVDPSYALLEQWLSNKDNIWDKEILTSNTIRNFIKNCSSAQTPFSQHYDRDLYKAIEKQECGSRYNLAILFAYLSYYSMLWSSKRSYEEKKNDLYTLLHSQDIPKFNGLLILGALSLYFSEHKDLKYSDTENTVHSYFQSFFAKKKKENNDHTIFLRNRCFDIYLWYMTAMKMERHTHFNNNSTPIIVTADKFLVHIMFRLLPPMVNKNFSNPKDQRLAFAFSGDGLSEEVCNNIVSLFNEFNLSSVPIKDNCRKNMHQSLINLYTLVIAKVDPEEKIALQDAWTTWLGFNAEELQDS